MRIPAAILRAFVDGAHAKRGGARPNFCDELFNEHSPLRIWREQRLAWIGGYEYQKERPGVKIGPDDFPLCFDMNALKGGYVRRLNATAINTGEQEMTRTAKQLEALRNDYRTNVYDPYAAEAEKNGQTPQDFDEAFNAHLAALDAAGDTGGEAKPAPKASKPSKAPKAPKEPAGPRTVGFRASSEDRKTINEAAAKVLPKDAKGKARCVPQDGQTYSDFLQGKVLKVTDGNGTADLNVVVGRSNDVVGAIRLTVKDGKLSAAPVKA